MPIKPQTSVDGKIFGIWRDAGPADAFVAGFPGYAGRVFIPSPENIDGLRKRIGTAQFHCETESQRKLLACMDTYLSAIEPASIPGGIVDTIFAHMIKEGIKVNHMTSLAEYGKKALRTYLETNKQRDWPIGLKLLATIRCDGLFEILNVVRSNTRSRALKDEADELLAEAKNFQKHVRVEGFSKGSFDEVWKIIRERGCALDRQEIYPRALHDLYDYPETPTQVEEKGLRFLENELSDYNNLVRELSEKLGCEARSEAVTQAIKDRKSMKPRKMIQFINKIRRLIVKIVDKRIVAVNPKYFTRVIETPPYLSGVIPSGAAFFLDFLTRSPRQFFLATTDPKRDPHTVPSELINLLVHEEYGHCLHSSNSALGYGAKPDFVDMLSSTLGGAVSEGISFQRELEFLDYLGSFPGEKTQTKEERSFVKLCGSLGGFEEVRKEYDFFTKTWRMTRFLRVIGDARINSGKQELADFIDWANMKTGLSKSMVYFQVFPAHQSIGPGYATTYAIIGESIREIQKAAVSAGKDFVKFNTYACSQGFPPRTVWESRLWEFVKS